MRSAETEALGKRMNMNDIIRKAKRICMAYCIKAIISPTCMVDWATWWEPTQMIRMVNPFMISIITGIISTMTRLTNRLVLVRSLLALSKRFSSNGCLLKARITIMPDRSSRVTRLRRSIRLCTILNFGRVIEKMVRIIPSRTMTARAMIHHMEVLLPTALITPPTPMMGA